MACLINLLNNGVDGVDGVDGFYGFNGVFDNLPKKSANSAKLHFSILIIVGSSINVNQSCKMKF